MEGVGAKGYELTANRQKRVHMANIRDIRRRSRSVVNTRQITKAMQMVAAAKLRRAQDRAVAARPYAQMLTNVLKALVSRADIFDPDTGEVLQPLLVRRPEKTALLIVVSGEKGLAGAFNSNILKAAAKFIDIKKDKSIDVLALGRKARDYFRRRYPVAPEAGEERAGPIQVAGEYVGLMNRAQFHRAREIAEKDVHLYTEEKIDSVYIVYNEFKSVLTQRLVVDDVLPIRAIGEGTHEMTEEASQEERKRRLEAAKHTGVSVRAADTTDIDTKAAGFATAQVDYIYEEPPERLVSNLLPRYISVQLLRAMLESESAAHYAPIIA